MRRFDLGAAVALRHLDDAFRAILSARTREALATGDVDEFRRNVFDLCDSRARAARVIDSGLPE